MRSQRLIRAAVVAAVFTAGPAVAAEPIETAIDSWIASIDASPNWTASLSAVTVDAQQRTATITGLRIATEGGAIPASLTFATITVFGYEEQPDGAFSAQQVSADGGKAEFGGVLTAALDDIRIDQLAVPSFANHSADPARPVTSVVKAYGIAARTRADLVRIGRFDFDQTLEGEHAKTSYGVTELRGLADGKIRSMISGPAISESSGPEGLVKFRIERTELRDMDLGAIVRALDPDGYVGGVGDMVWHDVVGFERASQIAVEFPGGSAKIDSMSLENVRVRQPSKSFLPALDRLSSDRNISKPERDALFADIVPSLLQFYGFGRFSFAGIEVTSPEIERFHLGEYRLVDLSLDGLKEFAIEDLDFAVLGQFALGLDRFAFGDMRFPTGEAISRTIEAQQSGLPFDPMPLIPALGFVELLGFDFTQGANTDKLDSLRLDLADHVGPIPTQIRSSMHGLDISVGLIDDPQAKEMLTGLGYERVAGDYSFRLGWHEADQSVTLDGFDLAIKDVGRITANATLRGLSRAALEKPETLKDSLPNLLFERVRVSIEDRSVVGRTLAMQAKKLNLSPEAFRTQIVGAVPLALMVLRNPTFQGKLAPALQAFLKAPGTIAFSAAPLTPVPVTAIEAAAKSAPQTLPDLLNVQIEKAPSP